MIKNLEIKNFKAIENAKVKLTPLTAFIGYNGSGKSSLLEALETFQVIVTDGLEKSMSRWRKFEHIHHKGKKKQRKFNSAGIEYFYAPMEFIFNAVFQKQKTRFSSAIGQDLAEHIYFLEESVNYPHQPNNFIRKRTPDHLYITDDRETLWLRPELSILTAEIGIRKYVESWQFLSMNTFLMGDPQSQKKTSGVIKLNTDGRNIAEYVLSIREKNLEVYTGILETLQYVLPYAKDLQPQITQELEKMVYLQLSEQDFKLPGWMLSTGTLKILALLAVFRHPEPSPLIVIEELENGLDPRTIHLVVSEIRNYIDNKKGQVLITSHSPYLLDQLHISQIVFVERKDEKVSFSRPGDDEEVLEWSKKFAPGQLYTQKGFSS
ncbi:AAA family ATPase [Aquiflexum sp. TKW24L]|uniref:AAA family ATPase n=1 Tax=Aquiflexum sp. TKW24L TaxID=2942212 RepID=UPI0020BD7A9C|nr:AAA family ATPase [Aquiflexum sp. TKW24L]MCL6259283.1 AAA family ATPase [Aquiflexum sp. TKW24L]